MEDRTGKECHVRAVLRKFGKVSWREKVQV